MQTVMWNRHTIKISFLLFISGLAMIQYAREILGSHKGAPHEHDN